MEFDYKTYYEMFSAGVPGSMDIIFHRIINGTGWETIQYEEDVSNFVLTKFFKLED